MTIGGEAPGTLSERIQMVLDEVKRCENEIYYHSFRVCLKSKTYDFVQHIDHWSHGNPIYKPIDYATVSLVADECVTVACKRTKGYSTGYFWTTSIDFNDYVIYQCDRKSGEFKECSSEIQVKFRKTMKDFKDRMIAEADKNNNGLDHGYKS